MLGQMGLLGMLHMFHLRGGHFTAALHYARRSSVVAGSVAVHNSETPLCA
jgi:hypothetical protein